MFVYALYMVLAVLYMFCSIFPYTRWGICRLLCVMENESLEQMMYWMEQGRKESFYIALGIFTFWLVIALLALLVVHWIAASRTVSLMLAIIAGVIFINYLGQVHTRWQRYKHKSVNESPWNGGIYAASYECSKCRSLHGGIYGKGPTQVHITDKQCIHDWQAVYWEDFLKKFIELTKTIE